MCQYTIAARSKLKNFAPKILLCAQLIVLSVRNANIVSDGKASELGILNFEFLLMQAAKPSGELFSCELEDFFLLISLYFLFVGAWPRRDAIASYVCTLSLQKKAIRLNNQGKTMIAKDSFVPLL